MIVRTVKIVALLNCNIATNVKEAVLVLSTTDSHKQTKKDLKMVRPLKPAPRIFSNFGEKIAFQNI